MKLQVIVCGLLLSILSNPVCLGQESVAQSSTPSGIPIPVKPDPAPPTVLTNPAPAKEARTEATQVLDANPSTTERVDKTPSATSIEKSSDGDGKFKVKKVEQRKTMSLALGGGGVRGAAHIGVLRVLEQEGIPIDYIVGNSMGAVIGGLYSSGVELDEMEKLAMKGLYKKNYSRFAIPMAIALPIAKILPTIGKKKPAGLLSGKRFEKAIAKMIPEGHNSFDNLRVPFSAVATDLLDGKAYRVSEGKLSTAIRASSTVSPLLKPVKIGERLYVDGGIRANLPASSARDTGADVVVAVLVDEPLRRMPESAFSSYRTTASRLADIVLAVTDEHQLKYANIIIHPDVSGIAMLADNPENVDRAIRAGEVAARKALPEIRKQMNLDGAKLVESPHIQTQ